MTSKISKVTLSYDPAEKALRISMLSKIGDVDRFNPCHSDNNCGENSNCISDEDDSYECECRAGYLLADSYDGIHNCVDINECASGDNICDPNAECINTPGGYNCQCIEGFEGNGYVCMRPRPKYHTTPKPASHEEIDEDSNQSLHNYNPPHSQPTHVSWDPSPSPSYPDDQLYPSSTYPPPQPPQPSPTQPSHPTYPRPSYPSYSEPEPRSREEDEFESENGSDISRYDPLNDCEACSQYADCINGECYCRDGWRGDGINCEYICEGYDIWDGEECVPNTEDEGIFF